MIDLELIREFTETRSEASFRRLVERHCDLVASVALRLTGDSHLAQDVTQQVFCILALKPQTVPPSVPLAAWLHRTCRTTAIGLVRSEAARRKRESNFFNSLEMNSEAPRDWSRMEPIIDTLIDRLPEAERQVVLMRFYGKQSYSTMGKAFGVSEEAVRKRLCRALEKLRLLLKKRGITTTSTALASLLPAHAVAASPSGLAASVASISLASASTTVSTVSAFSLILMKSTTSIAIIAVSASILGGTIFIIQSGRSSPDAGEMAASEDRWIRKSKKSALQSEPSRRVSSSRQDAQRPKPEDTDLAELKLIMAYADGEERDAKLAEFLEKVDADGAKQALDYLVSLGDEYWMSRDLALKAWAKLDPAKAIAWAGKNTPNQLKAVLGIWASNDPDAAIAWASAHGSATLDGNPYYATVIKNLSDTPDRIDKATALLLSQPGGFEAGSTLDAIVSHLEKLGVNSTIEWVDKLPEDLRSRATAHTILDLSAKDPVKTFDWARNSGFFTGREEHGIFQVVQAAIAAGQEEEVARYIDHLPDGEDKIHFQNGLAKLERLQESDSSQVDPSTQE